MRQTPVNDYLEEISTELPEELYGNLSDAIYETACEFDEEVAQLKAENAKLRKERDEWHRVAESKQDIIDHMRDANAENTKLREHIADLWQYIHVGTPQDGQRLWNRSIELGIEV